MRCPKCKCWALKVVDSRKKDYHTINKRVLMCAHCLHVFSVTETIDEINNAKDLIQDNETYRLFELDQENKKKKS